LIGVKTSAFASDTMDRDAPSVPSRAGGGADSMQYHSYLACAPRDAGVTAALFYVPRGTNVRGWLAGGEGARRAAAFFVVEGYYSADAARFCRSVEDDVRGRWIEQTEPVTTEIRCPIPEAERAEVSRLQSAFVREWFFDPGDPQESDEVAAYRKLGFPLRPVNVRSTQLHRFDQHRPVWVHASLGIDFNLVLYLKKRLPLDRREARVLA
jgi:hypothetical protein